MTSHSTITELHKTLRLTTVLAMLLGLFAPLAQPTTTYAASVTSAAFTGGAGTFSGGSVLYAKQGAPVTLTVITSSDTQCVDVAGAFTAHQESSTAKSTWTFTTTAGSGNGVQAVTAAASTMNKQGKCTGQSATTQISYTLDNTGPVLLPSNSTKTGVTPAPNAAGWNNSNVTINWSATDAGSGVASGPTCTDNTVTANFSVVNKTATATDRLGNVGNGSVEISIDKNAPSISYTTSPALQPGAWYNGPVTVSFTCDDPAEPNNVQIKGSGIASCPSSTTLQPGQSVTGKAVDNAGNSSQNVTVGPFNIDNTKPSLSGAPTTQPNAAGWYKGDVSIKWTCSDAQSGIAGSCPPNSTIGGSGEGLTATASVADNAGNTTTATSSPAVNIDRMAPTTGISGTSNNWTNGGVTVTLAPTDNLSGVAATSYTVDGGAAQTGTSFKLSTEGDHTISFFSTDKAGNAETAQTAHVKIDKTAPTIGHSFTPLTYKDGAWTNQDVTVTFACADQGGSGVASCTAPVTKTAEGGSHQVTGTATDNAGNSATDTATVSIDKTAPTINPVRDRLANSPGWYNNDVTVTFDCRDTLSGIDSCPTAKTLGEGQGQGASGTAIDAAGNRADGGITGINVDKTAPSLSGTPSTTGWSKGDVTVRWTASDALSGLASSAPADSTVSGEGNNLSASATVSDLAGNSTNVTVSGIKIDRTAPTTTARVPDPLKSGWYAGAVQVTLTGHDGLSGVDTTYYTIDGGAAQTYNGAFSFATKGVHTIAFWSTDNAGNTEDKAGNSIALKIDGIAPTTTVINPISPDSGWFVTGGIPFAFAANDAESGIAATYYTIDGGAAQTYGVPFTADLSTGSHTVTYWSVDIAGNKEATQSLTLKVDTIAPEIKGAATPAANSFGWNNTDVDVKFTCTDADSGINEVAGCAGDTTLMNEGAGQKVHGDAVDVAGNRSSTDFGPVNIDKTKPTLTGAATADANGASWYKGDVTIAWTGVDKLSGIDPATQPANSTITGEGSNLGAGPVTIKDKAGNVSDPASVSGIKIDRTAPVVSGTPTGIATNGWYKSAVTVTFTCSDPKLADGTDGSGVANCADNKFVNADGANQSVTSDAVRDRAGNEAVGKTVSGINIDSQEPKTDANILCEGKNNFCKGAKATIALSATDQTGLSGVKEIRYSTDNGAKWTTITGASGNFDITLNRSGNVTVLYKAIDIAGNEETNKFITVKYDTVAPAVTHMVVSAPNPAGWNNADTKVTFSAEDDSDGSGVASLKIDGQVVASQAIAAAKTISGSITVSEETASRTFNAEAEDFAGNIGKDSETVRLDKTAPKIEASVSGTLGANAWYTGPVTVKYTCTDILSGIPTGTCPKDDVFTNNGATQSVTAKVKDAAGNETTVTTSGIKIDSVKPEITINGLKASYTLGEAINLTCSATDTGSGVDANGCKITVTGGNANGVGSFTYTAAATDNAGNTSTATGSYTVTYRFDGFLQPINDTAHQVGTTTSIFKAASTVPVKFQLKKADGTVVQTASAPQWLTPVKVSATTASVDEALYGETATSGSTYRWDGTAQQYIYNWGTSKTQANYYWRIGVKLDDGQVYYVNIGLR